MALARLLRGVLDGLRLRCPACRRGRLFRSLTQMNERCDECGADLHGGHGEWSGALMFAQGIFGMVALMGWFALLLLEAPAWIGWAWLVGFALAPLPLYRNLKGAWLGLLHAGRAD